MGRGYPFVACLSHCTIDHAPLSRRRTVPTPNRDTSNIWALITFFPCITGLRGGKITDGFLISFVCFSSNYRNQDVSGTHFLLHVELRDHNVSSLRLYPYLTSYQGGAIGVSNSLHPGPRDRTLVFQISDSPCTLIIMASPARRRHSLETPLSIAIDTANESHLQQLKQWRQPPLTSLEFVASPL